MLEFDTVILCNKMYSIVECDTVIYM